MNPVGSGPIKNLSSTAGYGRVKRGANAGRARARSIPPDPAAMASRLWAGIGTATARDWLPPAGARVRL